MKDIETEIPDERILRKPVGETPHRRPEKTRVEASIASHLTMRALIHATSPGIDHPSVHIQRKRSTGLMIGPSGARFSTAGALPPGSLDRGMDRRGGS